MLLRKVEIGHSDKDHGVLAVDEASDTRIQPLIDALSLCSLGLEVLRPEPK